MFGSCSGSSTPSCRLSVSTSYSLVVAAEDDSAVLCDGASPVKVDALSILPDLESCSFGGWQAAKESPAVITNPAMAKRENFFMGMCSFSTIVKVVVGE